MSEPTPLPEELSLREQQALRQVIIRMTVRGLGIAMGLLFALGLFAATNILILRGGENIGAHLGLLAAYFPGYRVSFAGSVIGSVYAFVIGYGIGCSIAIVYNRLVDN
jgi:hypothetical protein